MTEVYEYPKCPHCGGKNVSATANVVWNNKLHYWEAMSHHDDGYCDDCEDTIKYFNWEQEEIQMEQTTNTFTASGMADANSAGCTAAASRRDDLIVTMLAMLQDLHDGYPWRELGIDMDEIHAHVAALGIKHEVSSSQP